MKTVITTVGTSLISNYLKTDLKDSFANLRNIVFSPENRKRYERDAVKIKNKLSETIKDNKDASAELSSLIKIQEKYDCEIYAVLITTDTILSNICAEVISDYFENNKLISTEYSPKNSFIQGLRIDDASVFQKEGLPNLINKLESYIYQPNVVMNFSGGYKGVIPYLTIMSQIYNVPMVYLFENSNELIEIPQAPIDISWDIFAKHKEAISELNNTIESSKEKFIRENNLNDIADIIEELNLDGKFLIALNPIGRIFWSKFDNYFIVEIPRNSKYITENADKKRHVTKAISELYRKLMAIKDEFSTLRDEHLKHAPLRNNCWIYKHTQPQIRIHYFFDGKNIKIFNYHFIQSESDDSNYSRIFEAEYERLKNTASLKTSFLKEN